MAAPTLTRVVTLGAGLVVLSLGVVGTYDLFADPANRLLREPFDLIMMLLGPSLIAGGSSRSRPQQSLVVFG